jgi:hypothetical protein
MSHNEFIVHHETNQINPKCFFYIFFFGSSKIYSLALQFRFFFFFFFLSFDIAITWVWALRVVLTTYKYEPRGVEEIFHYSIL